MILLLIHTTNGDVGDLPVVEGFTNPRRRALLFFHTLCLSKQHENTVVSALAIPSNNKRDIVVQTHALRSLLPVNIFTRILIFYVCSGNSKSNKILSVKSLYCPFVKEIATFLGTLTQCIIMQNTIHTKENYLEKFGTF